MFYDLLQYLGFRKPNFLLPETTHEYRLLLLEAKGKAREIVEAVGTHGMELLSKADHLSDEAEEILVSSAQEPPAKREITRRKAASLRKTATELRKKGNKFLAYAERVAVRPWLMPIFDPVENKNEPPIQILDGKVEWAEKRARCWEQGRIVTEGFTVYSTTGELSDEEAESSVIHGERRVIRYRNRSFLVELLARKGGKRVVHWATDSIAQMNEWELRALADAGF